MLLSYILFAFVFVVTPGATTALVVRNTLAGGRHAGLATGVGAAIANSSHATAAGLGLALLIARWPSSLLVIRFAGGAYLAWLGAVSVWRAVRHADGGLPMPSARAAVSGDRRRYVAQGFMLNIANPSIITFYLAGVPSFMPAGASSRYFALLAAIHVTMAMTCHTAWSLALDRVRKLFQRPGARRALEAISGVALLGLAARILL